MEGHVHTIWAQGHPYDVFWFTIRMTWLRKLAIAVNFLSVWFGCPHNSHQQPVWRMTNRHETKRLRRSPSSYAWLSLRSRHLPSKSTVATSLTSFPLRVISYATRVCRARPCVPTPGLPESTQQVFLFYFTFNSWIKTYCLFFTSQDLLFLKMAVRTTTRNRPWFSYPEFAGFLIFRRFRTTL